MAQDQSRPLVFPILLITVGALFLYATYRPAFDPWPVIRTYWPLILIFVGVGKIWDSTQRRKSPEAGSRSSIGSTIGVLAFVLVLIALIWHGLALSHERRFSSSMRHEVRTVERQDAQSVRVSLEVGAGELTVGGGSSHLMDGDFNFGESYGPPRVEYNVANRVGELSITQEGERTHFGGGNNDWNLHFSNEIPFELKITMGAGHGHLRLRDVPVTRLDMEMGAGQADLDLTGDRKKDLVADLEGGVGQATIHLPKNVGVVAHASGGIGAVSAHGFKHDNDEYTNEAYGKTPATIRLTVQGGVGQINLIEEP